MRTTREDLLTALQIAANSTEKNATLPIIRHVLIDPGKQQMIGINMSICARVEFQREPTDEAAFCVEPKKLIGFLSTLPPQTVVTMKQSNGKALVTAAKSRVTLATLPAEDYPMPIIDDANAGFAVKQCEFRELLAAVAHASAKNDVRYYLNGVHLVLRKGALIAEASDGYRLARSSMATDCSDSFDVILPVKVVGELIALLSGSGGDLVALAISDQQAVFRFGDVTLQARLIDGKFPDIDRVPFVPVSEIIVPRADLKRALSRASLLASVFRGVKLVASGAHLNVEAVNSEAEEAEDAIEIAEVPTRTQIGINVDYLASAIDSFSTDDVTLIMSDGTTGMKVTAPGKQTCLIASLRT